MDTRKLIAAFAITCSSLTLFAGPTHVPSSDATIETVPTNIAGIASQNIDIGVYQNLNGSHVIKWNAEGARDLEYLLQGAKDGKNFRLIKKITASSNTLTAGHYEATDDTGKGYTHFRIIRIDQAGNISYSKIASAP